MTKLIKNGTILLDGQCVKRDLLIESGRLVLISPTINLPEGASPDDVYDATGLTILPGLVDVHVHFREPGFSYKETIETGSKAAAHGGYTTVCTMPNLNPVPDTLAHVEVQLQKIEETALIEVQPYASITMGQKGAGTLVDFKALKDKVVAFSDDGCGVQSEALMLEAMRQVAPLNKIIVAHCEDNTLIHGGYIHEGIYAKTHHHLGICSRSEWQQIERDINLVRQTGCAYHICHISTKESVELIRQAKKEGLPVTCETAPHYLLLTENDLKEEGRFKMNPPLRSNEDQAALILGIQDGTIDCISTDHAPHTQEEKSKGLEKSAFGIVGLETAFPLMYTYLVERDLISFSQLLDLLSFNARRIFSLGAAYEEGSRADLAFFDLQQKYKIASSEFFSQGKSTPFEGWDVQGKIKATMVGGELLMF